MKLFWFMMRRLVNMKFNDLTSTLMLGKVNPLLLLVLHFELNLNHSLKT